MARWEPNAAERLERAALALFLERGYDATTVAEIANRAGLTKSTFFRHYADKREVLFGGQDIMAGTVRRRDPDRPAVRDGRRLPGRGAGIGGRRLHRGPS